MKLALTLIALAGLSLAFGLPAAAHEFIMPEAVVADGAGGFVFPVIVEITTPAAFGSVYMNGTDNTDIAETWADGFCMTVIQPGVQTATVSGRLLDLTQSGSVYYQHDMCDGWSGSGTITILPPAVATTPVDWSAIKVMYR